MATSVRVTEIATIQNLKSHIASLQEQLTGTNIYPSDVLENIDTETYNSIDGEPKVRYNDKVYYLTDSNGDEVSVTGTITAIDSTELTVTIDDETYGMWDASANQFYDTIDKAKGVAEHGYDGDAIIVWGYWKAGIGECIMYRDFEEDNSSLEGTDWNDNGLINNKLLMFGAKGRAYRLKTETIKLTTLGAQSNNAVDDYLELAIEFAKDSTNKVIDIDVTNTTLSKVMPTMTVNSGYNSVKMKSSLGLSLGYHIKIDTITEAPFVYEYCAGGMIDTVLKDLHFYKESGGALLRIQGVSEQNIQNCYLSTSSGTLIELSNGLGKGTFTEFINFFNCKLRGDRIFHLMRGDGNESFNGCGWDQNTEIYINDGGTEVVLIGDDDDTGEITWADSQIGGTVFYMGDDDIHFINFNDSIKNLEGNLIILRGEMSFKLYISKMTGLDFDTAGQFAWVGGVTDSIASYQDGALLRAHTAEFVEGGYLLADYVPARRDFSKAEGVDNFLIEVPDDGYGVIISMIFMEADYYINYLLRYTGQNRLNSDPSVEILATPVYRVYEGGESIGSINFEATEDGLLISNDNWEDQNVTILSKIITSSGKNYGTENNLIDLENYLS